MGKIDLLVMIMEFAGIVAFAVSGAATAIKHRMDIMGVNVLAVVTAVGGGIIRDIILGRTPPAAFTNYSYILMSLITANIVFIIIYIAQSKKSEEVLTRIYDMMMKIFDTIGLGVFTVTGMNAALERGYDGFLIVVFSGFITGVGGGMLSDIIANRRPYVLIKHVYASASLLGAVLFYSI